MTSKHTQIAFIGGGNMAQALIAGLIADGHNPGSLLVSDPNPACCERLAAHHGVQICPDNAAAVAAAEVVVLCIKPQIAAEVCRDLAGRLPDPAPLIVSVIAGITESSILGWLGQSVPLVRCMPNTPAMLQSGAIGMHASDATSPEQRNLAEEVLRAGGLIRWVEEESQLDAVTALSGSGPAYFFLFMEALEAAGREQGLDPETARLLSIQTALGAARMAMESKESPEQLRRRVTSPGGTTERALGVFDEGDLRGLVQQAMAAARGRAAELSKLFGDDQ